MDMKVHIPEDIREYEPELRFFFDTMIRKLHINKHKGFAADNNPERIVKRINEEMAELRDALNNESQFEVFLEAVDVANFAWLLGVVVFRMDRDKFQTEQQRNKNYVT